MRQIFMAINGIVGGIIAACFGGWDTVLQTLVLFMIIDWVTGGILLPAVFKKSPKSENGALESHAGWKGLCRKSMMLLCVLIAVRLDLLMGTGYLRDAVCIGFIANEALSIVENAGLMGVPLPGSLKRAVDVLQNKSMNLNGNCERKEVRENE
ncbi:phage holin family protein [Dorea acetigenes]|jgi:toxin secretion/phage lysis holin|uniref:Phage holin family protein n=1 Tax=Dorea acetigenes TaxID=2981787 RepID=A0ABT2RLY9_9FIRM|nr:phage holin family protein [Dorea acetigenes]MCU6686179.1 phage holin family protein [Dorea acetigenes]SCI81663.1 Phage-related holin (Lysis protein) [uncultured Clostridium sp.]